MSTFALPDLGEGLEDAEIVAWHVAEGDHVVADAPLVSVETEKAVIEIPSPRAGFVKALFGQVGQRVKVGAPLVEFADTPHADSGTVVGELAKATPAVAPAPTQAAAAGPGHPVSGASPAVRALARQLGVALSQISGSGPHGLITRADVEAAAAAARSPGQPTALSGVRLSMATNMSRAHAEVVPASVWDAADIEAWWSRHADVTVRLIRAIAVAAAAMPMLNAWYDSPSSTLRSFEHVDLGVAVDLEGGLIVPVLRDVGQRDAATLRGELDRLKVSVRSRTVPPADLRGPTITLSNFGMFAGRHAALVVLPPQVAIVGAGRIAREAVPINDALAFRHRLPLSLTFDHRVVTGGEAARFLKALIDDLERAA